MLTGQAKTDYQREYMRRYRNSMNTENGPEQEEIDSGGYIYVIHCEETQFYKVGMTRRSIDQRIKELQTGCPYKLQLLMMFGVSNPEEMEANIQDYLSSSCVRLEWYELEPQDLAAIIYIINPLIRGHEIIAGPAHESDDGRL